MIDKKMLETEKLEYQYLQKITYYLKFISDELIKQVKHTYDYFDFWKNKKDKAEDFSIGIERLFYSFFSRYIFGNALALPVASDICFEDEKAIIHIDIKTINVDKNDSDGKTTIFVGKNQFSYNGVFAKDKLEVKSGLPQKYTTKTKQDKTCLTYFIIVYYNNQAQVEKISLCCFPNGVLEPHYKSRVFKKGKDNKGGVRFDFTQVGKFELLENQPKRILTIYQANQKNDYLSFY